MLPELHAVKMLSYRCFTTYGGRGHFRSRDKDGGNIIRSAIAETPCHMQTLRFYLLQNRSYCRLKFMHCGNREFCVFLRKTMGNIIFPIRVAKLMQIMTKQIFWSIVDCSSLLCCRSYTHSR